MILVRLAWDTIDMGLLLLIIGMMMVGITIGAAQSASVPGQASNRIVSTSELSSEGWGVIRIHV